VQHSGGMHWPLRVKGAGRDAAGRMQRVGRSHGTLRKRRDVSHVRSTVAAGRGLGGCGLLSATGSDQTLLYAV
jgi:hypothetical protein